MRCSFLLALAIVVNAPRAEAHQIGPIASRTQPSVAPSPSLDWRDWPATPGTAPSPGPIKTVAADRLRSMLGITDLVVKRGQGPLALTNSTLEV